MQNRWYGICPSNFASSCEDVTHEFAGLSISQIMANEFKYHQTCYWDLTNSKSASTWSEKKIEEDNIQESCFAEMAKYVKDYVISEANVLKMGTLAETS